MRHPSVLAIGIEETMEGVMKLWQLGGIAALMVVGVAAVQEKGKETKAATCGMTGICCPKEGKCEGDCRTICDRAGETLATARKRAGDKMQKVMGSKCECTAGGCTAAGCEGCDLVKSKVLIPLMKERISVRFKDWKKEKRWLPPQALRCKSYSESYFHLSF